MAIGERPYKQLRKFMGRLALVMSAGGARGAYEAGVIYFIRTGLPKDVIRKDFDLLTGTSVGAINTAMMASMAHDPFAQGEKIKELWLSLKQDDIYRRDFLATTHFLGSTVGGIFRNLATFNPFKIGKRSGPHFTSFLDTSPLRSYLKKTIPFEQIAKNVKDGPLDAVVVNATNLGKGNNELFLHKKNSVPYLGHYVNHEVPIDIDHVMASSAIPIIFPPVKIDNTFYADGGLRLFTPMSPAIQLGADRLIIIGLRRRASNEEVKKDHKVKKKKEPTISDQMGRLLNGIFLDRIQYDMMQLDRINRIIDVSEKIYGKDYLEKVNQGMVKQGLKGDIASRGLKKIKAIEIHPSEFISTLFIRWFQRQDKRAFEFSSFEKLLIRLLDIDPRSGKDLMSYLTFAPTYLQELFELGFQDAQREKNRIIEMMGKD